MDTTLWLIQALLFTIFMYSGWMKSTRSAQQLVAIGQTGVEHLPTPLIRFIGLAELAGAIGVVAPWYVQILPSLTPIAAMCLGVIMVPAGVIHYRRNEKRTVWLNVAILALCGFLALGRFTQVSF